MGGRTTLSFGLRYDLELIPLNEQDNPLFSSNSAYPVDRNNISPRIGVTHALDANGKSVIRGGYGMFYNRTILGAVDDAIEFSKYTTSTVVNFPNNSADPGPSNGRFPSDPFLVNGPVVNWDLLRQQYPLGVSVKNGGDVIFDSPDRKVPFAHQATVGYSRELAGNLAVSADYVHAANRDMFLARNLNPMLRANTSRTGPLVRLDAFGVLGESYAGHVWVMENTGYNDYDALNLSLERRYANRWSGRVSYSLSKSTGTGENQADRNTYQKLTDLNLDAFEGPSSVDRRHVLAINGRAEIPKTAGANVSATLRYMSGAPFSIFNSAHRCRSERRAQRSVAGRDLQRDGHRTRCRREEQWRAQRCDRPGLLPDRHARRLAEAAARRAGGGDCSSTSSTSPIGRTSTTRQVTSGCHRHSSCSRTCVAAAASHGRRSSASATRSNDTRQATIDGGLPLAWAAPRSAPRPDVGTV